MEKSSMDIAYELLKNNKGGVDFASIWEEVARQKDYSAEEKDEKISNFYTDILLDGRFITHGENIWDLREDNPFDKVHIDMNAVYASDDDDDFIESEDGILAKEDFIDEDDEDDFIEEENDNEE